MAGVLDGVRVFDLTLVAVGPWASKLLAQLGADVIRVESPAGDMSHGIPPRIHGTGALYISVNHNKRQIVLDLKRDEDREKARRLVEVSDIFLQNMRPGAVERLGLSYEAVRKINPQIVYLSASAYGNTGPMATEAGVDPLLQAFSGFGSISGPPGSQGEMYRHLAHLDLTTSSTIVEAVLLALLHRERTGEGQHVEVEMLTSALSLQTSRLAEFFATGSPPQPSGSAAATTAPHEAFRCRDDVWLAVGVVSDDQWPRFCRALGVEGLVDEPRFADNPSRVRHRTELSTVLAKCFASRAAAWWTLRLTRERVPNSRILDFDAIRTHPQVAANAHLLELDTPHWGRLWVENVPWRFERTPADPVRPGGLQGEHTEQVLAEFGIK